MAGNIRTLDEIKKEFVGPVGEFSDIWQAILRWSHDPSMALADVVDATICAAIDEAYATGRVSVAHIRDNEIDRLRALFRVNMLRCNPAISHAEIDAALAAVNAGMPPADPFQPSQQPAASKPADAYIARGDASGVNAPKAAPVAKGPSPRHGIGRMAPMIGEPWR